MPKPSKWKVISIKYANLKQQMRNLNNNSMLEFLGKKSITFIFKTKNKKKKHWIVL